MIKIIFGSSPGTNISIQYFSSMYSFAHSRIVKGLFAFCTVTNTDKYFQSVCL